MFTTLNSRRVFAFCAMMALASGLLAAGCNMFDDSSTPTAPQSAALRAEQAGQCFATSEAPTEWAYSYTPGEAVFCVSVPEPGAYLLRYVVNGATYEVVFEISAAKRVYIGLASNDAELTSVTLQRGTLIEGATPLEGDRGDINFYAIPGSGVATGSVIADLSEALALSNNGAPCLVIIPTPAPAPVAPSAPTGPCPSGWNLILTNPGPKYLCQDPTPSIPCPFPTTPVICPAVPGFVAFGLSCDATNLLEMCGYQ